MGLEFIRKTKRDFAKAWSRGMNAVAMPDLFDPKFTRRRVIVSAKLLLGESINQGQIVSIDRCPDGIRVSIGLKKVGLISAGSSDLQSILDERNGNALGMIERLSLFKDTADIVIP